MQAWNTPFIAKDQETLSSGTKSILPPRETFTLDTEKALTELEKVLSEIFTELFEQYENDP